MDTEYENMEELIDNWTGPNQWNAVLTVQLGELIEAGVFDWEKECLNWSSAAYDDEQYERVCTYFVERFRYREISIEPFLEWAQCLKRKLVFELMPKYKMAYAALENGMNPTLGHDEVLKERSVFSDYPETLLSANADYVSSGTDKERERLSSESWVSDLEKFKALYHSVDESLLDELESMFIQLYSMNINGF